MLMNNFSHLSRFITAYFLGGLCLGATAMAATSPPVIDEHISKSHASWRAGAKPSDGLSMGTLKVQLEQTTLSEVLRTVGSGAIDHQGDAAENIYWLCYTGLTDGRNLRVWIEASGEMGGPEHRVTNIAVRTVAGTDPVSDCPALSEIFEKMSFNNGIWLGASQAAVQQALPLGLLHIGKQAFVGYQGKVANDGQCNGGYDVLNSFYLTFRDGVVVAIDAGQVTSC